MLRRQLIAGTAAFAVAPMARAQAQSVILTGPLGGAWYPIGSGMVEALQNKAGLRFTQQPGGGVSNAFNVGAGKAQLGFSTGGVAASAVNGTFDFENRAQKNLRLLTSLFDQEYTLVVWADGPIRRIADLKGRTLQTTARGSSTELMTRRVLEAHGLSYGDLKAVNHSNVNDGVNQMKDGQVDGMSHLITNPAAHGIELASSRPVRTIALEAAAIAKLVATYPGYTRGTIKGGLYAGQAGETATVNEPVLLVTRAELDDDTVYKMTKALFESQRDLAVVHKVMEGFNARFGAANPVIAIHPGALRYFREAGVVG
jgi:TRAP transporter TAXI family solute receptor